ncbi:putative glutathione-dependent formaldehyde-activating enzyme [Sarocladium strictum]
MSRSLVTRKKTAIASIAAVVSVAAFVLHAYKKTTKMSHKLHPTINNGISKGKADFSGGTLLCKCTSNPVEVTLSGNVAHNHACGCSKCWKPDGALFSVVGVIPREQVQVTANESKLYIVDESATIQRHACNQCGVHMYGRIETAHPFKGLDFVHTELSPQSGWQEPQFAAFVSSVIEQGFAADKGDEMRAQFKALGIPAYDCLSPALMDAIAAWTYKSKL